LAKATRRPVVLACTSGTAAAEYLPAVVEAHEAGVPLLVLTADRPAELREVGAGQTIDQLGLYGRAARWFFDVGTGHAATPERARWMRSLACRAVWAASAGARPGPVHLNWPLREPLVPPAGPRPDVVLRIGDLPTSKPLRQWLAALDAPQIAFAPEGVWHDPDGALAALLPGDPRATLAEAAGPPAAEDGWLRAWTDADAAAARAIDATLGPELSEPRVARELVARLPARASTCARSPRPSACPTASPPTPPR